MGYPGIPLPPPPPPAASSSSAKQSADPDSDSVDAYEAAQTILKAINFGNLLQLPAEGSDGGHGADDHQSQQSGLETLLSHVQAALASSAAEATAVGSLPVTGPAAPLPRAPPTNVADPRAELQAQLALLAAQLAELSQAEETASLVQDATLVPLPVPIPVPTCDDPPPQIPQTTSAISGINPAETNTQNDEDSGDDDDMEEII